MLPDFVITTGKQMLMKNPVSEKEGKIKIWQIKTDCGRKLTCPNDDASECIYSHFHLPGRDLYFEKGG